MALSSIDIERHIRRVVSPSNPLRRMTTRELIQEQERLEHLEAQAAIANLEAFLDANEGYLVEVAMARDAGMCVTKIRQRLPQECVVVDPALSAQLDLRLRLCQGELARRRRTQSPRHKPRARIH